MAGSRFGGPPPARDDSIEAAANLARRVHAGDPEAEAELVARYRAGVAMILRKLVKDPELAADLTQEVFRIAIESLRRDRLDDSEKLAAYLWGISRNLANTEGRRLRRHPEAAADEGLVDSAILPDEQLQRSERARLVRHALAALAPRDRIVLREFFLNDAPKDAICRRLRLTPAQFDVIKWRALKRLRLLLLDREGRE